MGEGEESSHRYNQQCEKMEVFLAEHINRLLKFFFVFLRLVEDSHGTLQVAKPVATDEPRVSAIGDATKSRQGGPAKRWRD